MDRPIPPVTLDPEEFADTLAYALAVSQGELIDEIRVPEGSEDQTFIIDGEVTVIGNCPEDRFGLAVAKKFRGREPELLSFMIRMMAMHAAIKQGVPPSLWAEEGEVRGSILHAAASCVMYLEEPPDKWRFNPEELYRLAEKLEGQ